MYRPFDRYQPGPSPLHQADPRVKVVVAFVLIGGITLTPERAWPAYPALWALVAGLAALARFSAWRMARLGAVALPFMLAALPLLITVPGPTWTLGGGVAISQAGLARFVAILLKSWLSVQVALLLTLTTPFADLIWALGSLRVPGTLVALIAFMVRYSTTLSEEAQRLLRARAARSAQAEGQPAGGTLFWRARVAGGMVGNLFLRSYERSERIYAAMVARGYSGEMRRLTPPPLSSRAALMGAVPVLWLSLVELAAVVWWR
jgi:cobalt/nickel transport system permease protein